MPQGSVQESAFGEVSRIEQSSAQASRIENMSSIQQSESRYRNFQQHVEDPRFDTADQISMSLLVDIDDEISRNRLNKCHALETSPNVYQEYGMLETVNLGLLRSK